MNRNPFDVTKAVDFSDVEIARTYVDFGSGALHKLLSPNQALPIFLVGGKGGGRTHLLRRFSHSVRHQEGLGSLNHVQSAGYLGVYFRCSGLNGSRFAGKGQTEDAWAVAFAAYMDLWITQLLLHALIELDRGSSSGSGAVWLAADKTRFLERIRAIGDIGALTRASQVDADPLAGLAEGLANELRAIDRQINNAAISGNLHVTVRSAPGELIFAATSAAQSCLPGLAEVKFSFLVDEFENLASQQQRYLNTLIREKPHSCTFVVGSRRWGVRTMETLTSDEPNRRGSEFQQIVLEDEYRASKAGYLKFCEHLVTGRLTAAGFGEWPRTALNDVLGGTSRGDLLFTARLQRDGIDFERRPHLDRLQRELEGAYLSSGSAADIVDLLRIESNPVLEKWAVLQMYRHWASQGPPNLSYARRIGESARGLLAGEADDQVAQSWKHWKHDLIAQIYVEAGEAAPYFGFEQFVELSGYLPRNLLVVLKNVTRWSAFAGEDPFATKTPIGSSSIRRGVAEAARWFRADSVPIGDLGVEVDRAVSRVGQLLRMHRLSAKPVEVGCSGFSSDLLGVSSEAIRVLESACVHGLLVESARSDRNSGVRHRAFQLAPMLAPEFDLSPARRGLLALKASEMNAVFDPTISDSDFDGVLGARLRSLTAPFREDDSAVAIF